MKKLKFLAMALVAMMSICSFVACSSNDDEEKHTYRVDVENTSTNYDNNSNVKAVVNSLVTEFGDQHEQAISSSEANGYFETLCANIASTVSSKGYKVFADTYCTLSLKQSSTSTDSNPTTATKQITFTSNAERSNVSIYFFVTSTNVMEMMSKVDLEFYNPTTGETVKKTITSADNEINEKECKALISAYNSAMTGEPYFVYCFVVRGVNVGQELKATASWTVDQSKAANYGDSEIKVVVPKIHYSITDGIKDVTDLSEVKQTSATASTAFTRFSEKYTSDSMTKAVDY